MTLQEGLRLVQGLWLDIERDDLPPRAYRLG